MGTNFTLNFCAPVIETIKDAVGIKESLLKNISAFYEWKGKTYSIGCVVNRANRPSRTLAGRSSLLSLLPSEAFGLAQS